ncbi:polysaccharide biosynthesis/export family protein [Cecembia calidifontis]|jgi:polysaccharide export outer membrane protein|uniref:Polysaccharide export outer membrane protein n=1 Tax=Cecembia calidifontis TaxID=1187080 RepID=A0A4Q7PH77_9BACT|nr:polysaccharide biosynthesis/export family protein [Cecembia calidifontis]RZS98252.1 polysaccharide export outer membrane protein [Cecembia calidifontis]
MRNIFILFFLAAVSFSCISNKKIVYLQNLPENEPIELDTFIPYAKMEKQYILQPFDYVDIDFAATDEELIKGFEFQGARGARGGGANRMGMMGGGDMFFFTGYGIDKDGFIEVPKLGKIKIGGLTEEQAKIVVQEAINDYFKEEVLVRLRIAGVRFTTLGEFQNVGNHVLLRDRVTIFEAVAAAGEPSLLGKRHKMFIIRQYDEGTKLHQVNLNDRALLASPFYFIQNNDILYLEPMKIRQYGRADNLLGVVQIVTGLVVTTLLFVNLFSN